MVSGSSQRGGSLSFSFAWGTQIWCLINAKCLTDFLAGRKRITWLLSTYVSPANLQPWRFRWWRSHAQVLHEIHPPSLLAWMRSSSSPTFPENRRHFFCSLGLYSYLEHLIPTSSTESWVLHHTQGPGLWAKWPPSLAGGSLYQVPFNHMETKPRAQGWSRVCLGIWVQVPAWLEIYCLRLANSWASSSLLCKMGTSTTNSDEN